MVQEDSLSLVLGDFARTMLTDFPIQGILDHLVGRIVEVLAITGAGVTLIAEDRAPRYVAASDTAALGFERLQTTLGQGPCLTAYDSGQAVAVADLAADDRYPLFAPAAVAQGLAAVFTFPLRHGEGRLGALDLYRSSPGELDAADLAAAQTLADVTAAYLLNAQAREEAQQASDRFRESALHDALTGLPNRVLLHDRLMHASQRARRSHSTAAVLFADLDRFKRINDMYGHAVGDLVLIAVANRLTELLRPGDTLARVSGDEFVILCEDLATPLDAELLASRITEAFMAPFLLPTVSLQMTASVGVAYAGAGESVSAQLMIDADTAMYHAKARGGGTHHVVDVRALQQARDRNDLEQELRVAITRNELDVRYQPIVRPADGVMVGVEALLRWTHPVRGPVPAAAAARMAEQNGSIIGIGAWVLERSSRAQVGWLEAHPDRPLDLSLNISGHQVLHPGYAASVAATLAVTGMDPTSLVLEVTENIFLADGAGAMRVFDELRALGVRLALDDFGTGYSSLGYLRRFPVDILKIDKSFVDELGVKDSATTLVTAALQLASGLGMTVIVEGVETEQQAAELVGMGCGLAQGYLYARPMSEADIGRVLSG